MEKLVSVIDSASQRTDDLLVYDLKFGCDLGGRAHLRRAGGSALASLRRRLKLPVIPAKLEAMGRFASTVEFYSRYREPYPPAFFNNVAELVGLRGNENLLDIGCGPGLLAIGFAPFVEHCTGIDPEAAMIAAARTAALKAGVSLTLIRARIEEFSAARTFDIITIGRALHWMDRDATMPVLERIVSDHGRILICGARSVETPATPWMKPYEDVRHGWPSDRDRKRYRLEAKEWFAGSYFSELATTSVTESRQVTIADLVSRALSKSNTSPAVLGERRVAFEAEISAVLEPFAQQGILQEQIVASASIFGRRIG
jgi:ubiquinone/menaquinone biosynthesis C-methylase UbiE